MGLLQGVGGDGRGVFLEADLGELALARILRRLLQRVLRTQAVADVRGRLGEVYMPVDERLVVGLVLDDVAGDVVKDHQIRMGGEDDRVVRQLEATVLEGGEHVDLTPRLGQAGVGQARPQDGVHLGHVGTPEHEDVRVFQVVVATHGLVDAEGADEGHHGGGHAVPGVGVQVVGAYCYCSGLGLSVKFTCRVHLEFPLFDAVLSSSCAFRKASPVAIAGGAFRFLS